MARLLSLTQARRCFCVRPTSWSSADDVSAVHDELEILVRHEQRARQAPKLLRAVVEELLQRARFVVTAALGAEQEIEPGASIGGERAALERELALEAVEHRSEHARDHRRSAARAAAAELDDERAERPRVRAAQRCDEDGNAAARGLYVAAVRRRVARALLLEQNTQVQSLEAVGAPDELREGVIERDAAGTREQHLDELRERRVATRRRAVRGSAGRHSICPMSRKKALEHHAREGAEIP